MNDILKAVSDCMNTSQNINISALALCTNVFAANRLIDSTDNLANDRVYIFSGMNDPLVLQGHVLLFNQ